MSLSFEGNFTPDQRTEIARIMAANANAGNTVDTASTKSFVTWLDADRVVITQDDGDVFVLRNMRFLDNPDPNIEDEKNLGGVETPTTETPKTEKPVTLPPASGTLEQQLATRQRQKAENEERIKVLEEQIARLQKEINEEIDAALKKVEGITDEQRQKAANIADEWLSKYSKGEVTYEEMQEGMKSDLTAAEGEAGVRISGALFDLFSASGKMSTLKELVGQMGRLIEENKLIDAEINRLQDEIAAEAARRAAAAAAAARNTSCDPIGFTVGDITYDFFIDKDNDGALSNENEFLGATNQWAEMQALDTDNDGKVSVQEMIDAGVKVVARDSKTGEQKVMDIADLNMEDIDLSTYSTAKAGDQGNGVNLLGNFNITVDGQTVEGYNTLDTLDYLDKNYDFSDKEKGIGRFGNTPQAAGASDDVEQRYAEIQKEVAKLETKLSNAWLTVFGRELTAKNALEAGKAQAYLDGSVLKVQKEAEEEAQRRIDASEEIAALKEAEEEAAKKAEERAAEEAE